MLDVMVVIAYARLVVTGGDSRCLHEAIITAGVFICEERFWRMDVHEVQVALYAALPEKSNEAVRQQLVGLWSQIEGQLAQAFESRIMDRTGGVQSLLFKRAPREE